MLIENQSNQTIIIGERESKRQRETEKRKGRERERENADKRTLSISETL